MRSPALEAIEAQDAGEELSEEQLGRIEEWEAFNPGPEQLQEEVGAYRGGYIGQLTYRAPVVAMFQTVFLLVFGFWRIGGLMLIGMALMKLGVLSARRSNGFYLNQGGYLPNYFGSLFLSFAYLSIVMLAFKSGILTGLTHRLAAVGGVALALADLLASATDAIGLRDPVSLDPHRHLEIRSCLLDRRVRSS